MTSTLIGYARCSTDKQDLTAQKEALQKLGVALDRIYTDQGFTGTNRTRPGLDQALAAVRSGDTLAYPRDNPGGTIRNVRVLKTTIKGVNKALISGRLWVVPLKGKKGKLFTFEHSLIKKNDVWVTESLHYNYIPNN